MGNKRYVVGVFHYVTLDKHVMHLIMWCLSPPTSPVPEFLYQVNYWALIAKPFFFLSMQKTENRQGWLVRVVCEWKKEKKLGFLHVKVRHLFIGIEGDMIMSHMHWTIWLESMLSVQTAYLWAFDVLLVRLPHLDTHHS